MEGRIEREAGRGSYQLTTSLLVILEDATPKLMMYSTGCSENTFDVDLFQMVMPSVISTPIGINGESTLVPLNINAENSVAFVIDVIN